MVDRQHCTTCGGMGRMLTSIESINDPRSEPEWEECPHCKGTGVEMASRAFEVYARFGDEVEAREFMGRIREDPAVRAHGIRAVDADAMDDLRKRLRGTD